MLKFTKKSFSLQASIDSMKLINRVIFGEKTHKAHTGPVSAGVCISQRICWPAYVLDSVYIAQRMYWPAYVLTYVCIGRRMYRPAYVCFEREFIECNEA